jgi:hypothetical protein
MTYPYVYLVIFSLLLYLVLTDQSIAKAVYLISMMLKIRYERLKWWLQYSPDNPIVRFLIWRRSYRLAKELQEEFDKKAKEE